MFTERTLQYWKVVDDKKTPKCPDMKTFTLRKNEKWKNEWQQKNPNW